MTAKPDSKTRPKSNKRPRPEQEEARLKRPDDELKDLVPDERAEEVRGGACDEGKHYPPVKV